MTYYEERNYNKALEFDERAYKIAPNCPLVLWDYAGTLQMLHRHEESLKIFRGIISKGIDRIANGECGEGRAWARGLIADCHFRISLLYETLGNEDLSFKELDKHLSLRGPGCRSIYPLKQINSKYLTLKNKRIPFNHKSTFVSLSSKSCEF